MFSYKPKADQKDCFAYLDDELTALIKAFLLFFFGQITVDLLDLQKRLSLFWSFPYVWPEPVLVK